MLATQEVTLKIKFPQSLLFDYGLTEKEAGAEILRAFVLSLYRRDKISSGKAAHLLGMHRLDFIRLLGDEGIRYLDYTSEELDADVQTLRGCLKTIYQNPKGLPSWVNTPKRLHLLAGFKAQMGRKTFRVWLFRQSLSLRDLLLKAPTLTDEEIQEYEKVGEWEGK